MANSSRARRSTRSFTAEEIANIIQDSDSEVSDTHFDIHSESDGDQNQHATARFSGQPVSNRPTSHCSSDTRWESCSNNYVSHWLPPFRRRTGVLVDTSDFDPVDYFSLFFPDEAFYLMVEQTNKYALDFFDCPAELPKCSRFNSWNDTNLDEMKAFVALQIAMGLSNKNELEDYWETWWLTHTPFSMVMSQNRFELMLSFLHFADNNVERPKKTDENYDILWKVKHLINICQSQYEKIYCPSQHLTIDESMIRFKGRLSIRQYLPNKPTKWGIKQYFLCESKTGYALKFITYCGRGTIPVLEFTFK